MAIESSTTSSSTSLAPGFRFHPTDEELVFYYLRRKICGKPFRFHAISDIDIYKAEPWDLPDKSRLKTRDMEWYFFSMLDKKFGNSQRTNRATEKGYWKTTGKDREVYHRSNVVGMKKTLVYHFGRAPKGERTNWVMHEYRLIDEKLAKAGFNQDSAVVCRVFQKSGPGPKNGETYGAPLVEEEWEKEEVELFPKMRKEEEVEVASDDYLDGCDLEQIIGTDVPSVVAPPTVDQYCGNTRTFVEFSTGSTNGTQNCMVNEQLDSEKQLSHLPYQYEIETLPDNHECESSKKNEGLDFLLDEPFWDAAEDLQFNNGAFLESNDLMDPIAADIFDIDGKIEESLAFSEAYDTNNDFFNNVIPEPASIVESLAVPTYKTFESEKVSNVETQQALSVEQLIQNDYYAASSSKKDPIKFAPASDQGMTVPLVCDVEECQYSFLKKASHMLESIPAPPAFAAEFPAKYAVLHLNPTSHSSSSVHVTAGLIQMNDLPVGNNGMGPSSVEGGEYNLKLSLGLSHRGGVAAHLKSAVGVLPEKSAAALSRSWFYFMFLWVLILSVSFKMGTLVCAR